jgi:hypothetical protein
MTFCQWSRIFWVQCHRRWHMDSSPYPGDKICQDGMETTQVSITKNVWDCDVHWQSDSCSVLGLQRHFAHIHDVTMHDNQCGDLLRHTDTFTAYVRPFNENVPDCFRKVLCSCMTVHNFSFFFPFQEMKQNYCCEFEPAVATFISAVLYSSALQLKTLSALLTIWSSSFMLRAYWILRSKSGVIFPSFVMVFLTHKAFCFTDLKQNKKKITRLQNPVPHSSKISWLCKIVHRWSLIQQYLGPYIESGWMSGE